MGLRKWDSRYLKNGRENFEEHESCVEVAVLVMNMIRIRFYIHQWRGGKEGNNQVNIALMGPGEVLSGD